MKTSIKLFALSLLVLLFSCSAEENILEEMIIDDLQTITSTVNEAVAVPEIIQEKKMIDYNIETDVKNPNVDTLIFIKKSACYGNCPVFSVAINTIGAVYYKGISNVEKEGNYTAYLTPETIKKITQAGDSINIFEKGDYYPESGENIADLQMTHILVKWDGYRKAITINHGAPDDLVDFIAILNKKLDDLDWREHKSFASLN